MHSRRRSGFTLIELLVVMGILMFLFGLGIGILPSVYQRWETSYGTQVVQNTLARARQEARRSGRNTGVRLMVPNYPKVTDIKFVQQPLDATDATLGQPGDYVYPDGAGLPMQLPIQAPNTLTANMRYRVVRQPQPIPGERTVSLPNNVVIDLDWCSTNGQTPTSLQMTGQEPAPSNAPYVDIVFTPFGCLSANNWPGDKVILWVRDVNLTDPTKGSPTLIVIYVRTGLIAAHPVDITGYPNMTNPYTFANDPRTSGL